MLRVHTSRSAFGRVLIVLLWIAAFLAVSAGAALAWVDQFGAGVQGVPYAPYTVSTGSSVHGGRAFLGDEPLPSDTLIERNGTIFQVPEPSAPYTEQPEPKRIHQYLR